ncbi:Flp pilus assembly protein CpaB [Peptoclostridium acidaminophilum DSM 3953]|uniref:Flp pilus assembly protein CpaB n=1 Tax=Peptoclostridium acidaminophilum DSM 3953 TaxID=1286171 RepID=W8T5C2_PEPAC|nr:Flp pilus assembly protein CpaB [Peptoclostridium acidaminophilum]AHM56954.1 Flp pilus assembly protein CpaB [Peptoclostridium acidaminophilum DSM 3953]
MKTDKKMVLLSILLGLITTFAVYKYIDQIVSENDEAKFTKVWVATADIPAKTKITAEMVEKKGIKDDLIAKGAYTESDVVVGKYAIDNIAQGEQLIRDRVGNLEKSYFSYNIPKNQRAVTLEVDSVAGVADLIRPGDYVDLITYFGAKDPYNDVAKDMLQNVIVLAVDKDFTIGKEPIVAEGSEGNRRITVAVNVWDAEKIVFAQDYGKVHLVLRNPDDKDIQETNGITRTDITNR